MNLAVLKISGLNWSPEDDLKVLSLIPDVIWHAGDTNRLGGVAKDTGASLTLADAESIAKLLSDIQIFFATHKKNISALSSLGLIVELDVGVAIGDSEQYTASLSFTPENLNLFKECGITLTISAYPTSDEANAKEHIAV